MTFEDLEAWKKARSLVNEITHGHLVLPENGTHLRRYYLKAMPTTAEPWVAVRAAVGDRRRNRQALIHRVFTRQSIRTAWHCANDRMD